MPYSANIRLLFSFFFLHLYPPPSLLQNPHPSIHSLPNPPHRSNHLTSTTSPQFVFTYPSIPYLTLSYLIHPQHSTTRAIPSPSFAFSLYSSDRNRNRGEEIDSRLIE